MQLIEDTPERLVYRKDYGRGEGRLTLPGEPTGYPCVLVLNAVVIIIVLSIVPSLGYPLSIIVCGGTAAWFAASLWMMYREDWKREFRRHDIVVDKTAGELRFVYQYKGGEVRTHGFRKADIHGFKLDDEGERYRLLLDVTMPTLGRWAFTLASFESAAERDAMHDRLADALKFPTEDAP